jgi:hypothetical protein
MMTNKIRNEILIVRGSGKTNMFDVPAVQQIADEMGYFDLALWLEDHRSEYSHFILTGEMTLS